MRNKVKQVMLDIATETLQVFVCGLISGYPFMLVFMTMSRFYFSHEFLPIDTFHRLNHVVASNYELILCIGIFWAFFWAVVYAVVDAAVQRMNKD